MKMHVGLLFVLVLSTCFAADPKEDNSNVSRLILHLMMLMIINFSSFNSITFFKEREKEREDKEGEKRNRVS